MRSVIRRFVIVLLAGFFCLPVWQPVVAARLAAPHPQTSSHAGLVIQQADGSITTACVAFSQEQISGFDLLQAAGVSVEASYDAMGAAVCSIGGTGCSADDCFCQFPPSYWSYWRLNGGSWSYSNLGASASVVHNGDVEGWAWGGGSPPGATPGFDEICAEALQPTVEPTLPPTATAESATNTPPPRFADTPVTPPTTPPEKTPTATIEPTATWAILNISVTPLITFLPTATQTMLPTPSLPSATAIPASGKDLLSETQTAAVQSRIAEANVDATHNAAQFSAQELGPTRAEIGLTATMVDAAIRITDTDEPRDVLPAIAGFLILCGGLATLMAFFLLRRS